MLESIKAWCVGTGLPAVIIVIIGLLIIRVSMSVLQRVLDASRLEKAAHSLIRSLAKVVLGLLLCLIVADTLHIKVGSIVALASVLTLAVSLSLQNMLGNVMGGFTLLYTHPFKSGDFVEIAGKSGTIQEIGMSYTVLTTPDNKQISIPNSSVVAGDIVNFSITGTRRLDIVVRTPFAVNGQKVIDALLQAATVDNVLLEPAPAAVIEYYSENATVYTLRVWTKTADYWDVNYQINQNIQTIFEAQDIPMTCPLVYARAEDRKS